MLKLNGVAKTYISKDRQRVDALRGVSFELENTGMVFILGKSGSGKSTLLNLLGGLDSPAKGEIVVDGVSMKDFKQTDYDSYRNSYVGFVFQEYNLLDNLDVKQNIELALQLSKGENIDEKVLDALTQVELSADYLTRRVGEMSGGEKQRIAIARSIVKDSKLILADEPTGNLDSATARSIWEILKKLSQTRLVVVVSHDRESAETYADRIIEIADGEIASDNGGQVVAEPNSHFVAEKKRLPFVVCLRMALNSLLRRKARAISAVIMSVLSTFAIVIMQMLLFFSPLDCEVNFVKQYHVPYIAVNSFNRDSFDYIAQNSDYISSGIVEGKQQVLDFGLTFVGEAQELDENSVYIRLDNLRAMSKVDKPILRSYVLIDGKTVPINDYADSLELLVGHQMQFSMNGLSNYYVSFTDEDWPILAGIIDTDAISKVATRAVSEGALPTFLSTKDCRYFKKNLVRISSDASQNTIVGLAGQNVLGDISVYNAENRISGRVITAHGFISDPKPQDVNLADDEIILTFDVYSSIFADAKSYNYYADQHSNEIKNTPEHIGETIEFKLWDGNGNVFLDLGSFKLVGVSMKYSMFGPALEINVTPNVARQLYFEFNYKSGFILIKTDSIQSIDSFIKTLDKEYNTPPINIGYVMYDGEPLDARHAIGDMFVNGVQMMTIIFAALGVVLFVVLILLMVNIISFGITSRKREIGILSALGTTQRDITNIFVFETLIIGVASFVFILIFLFAMIVPINLLMLPGLQTYVPFLNISWLTVAIVLVATLALPLLAASLPIFKLSRLKPVDAIRDI